jgi:hypothetical protein
VSNAAWIETLYLCNTSGALETEVLVPTDIDAFTDVFVATRAASPPFAPSLRTDGFSVSATTLPEGESGRKGDTDFLLSFWLWVVVGAAALLITAGAAIAIHQLRKPDEPTPIGTEEEDSIPTMIELPEEPALANLASVNGDMRCDFENPMGPSAGPDTVDLGTSEFSAAGDEAV